MKTFLLTLTLSILVSLTHAQETPDLSGRDNIPSNLREAILALDTLMHEQSKERLKESTLSAHFGAGMWIRNNWLYKPELPLRTYLRENGLGMEPDGMSSAILSAFSLYLKAEEGEREEVIENYITRRRRQKEQFEIRLKRPEPEQYPRGLKKATFSEGAFDGKVPYEKQQGRVSNIEDSIGVIHLIRQGKRKYWLYEYDRGWAKVDRATWDSVRTANFRELKELTDRIEWKDSRSF